MLYPSISWFFEHLSIIITVPSIVYKPIQTRSNYTILYEYQYGIQWHTSLMFISQFQQGLDCWITRAVIYHHDYHRLPNVKYRASKGTTPIRNLVSVWVSSNIRRNQFIPTSMWHAEDTWKYQQLFLWELKNVEKVESHQPQTILAAYLDHLANVQP